MNTRIVKIAAFVVAVGLGPVLIVAMASHSSTVAQRAENRPPVARTQPVSDTNPIFGSEASSSSFGLDPARTTDW
jgi:hypothetical protein